MVWVCRMRALLVAALLANGGCSWLRCVICQPYKTVQCCVADRLRAAVADWVGPWAQAVPGAVESLLKGACSRCGWPTCHIPPSPCGVRVHPPTRSAVTIVLFSAWHCRWGLRLCGQCHHSGPGVGCSFGHSCLRREDGRGCADAPHGPVATHPSHGCSCVTYLWMGPLVGDMVPWRHQRRRAVRRVGFARLGGASSSPQLFRTPAAWA